MVKEVKYLVKMYDSCSKRDSLFVVTSILLKIKYLFEYFPLRFLCL
jgi:hypothetical protein